MNIREILQNSIRAQQRGLLDIPDEVAEVVKKVFSDIKEDKTLGRASEGSWGHLDGYVNVIPSKRKGICTPIFNNSLLRQGQF